MALYNPGLTEKPQIIAVNKIDLPEVQAHIREIKESFKSSNSPVYLVSAINKEGTNELMTGVADILSKIDEAEAYAEPPVKIFRPEPRI